MLQNAAKKRHSPKPPGGRRVSNVEVTQRLGEADRMLRAGRTRGEVVALMRAKFGMSERAADSYIAKTRSRWAEESKTGREGERDASLARLAHLSERAEMRGAFSAAVAAEKLRGQILGLFAPVTINASVTPVTPEIEMTAEEAQAELDALADRYLQRLEPPHDDRERD